MSLKSKLSEWLPQGCFGCVYKKHHTEDISQATMFIKDDVIKTKSGVFQLSNIHHNQSTEIKNNKMYRYWQMQGLFGKSELCAEVWKVDRNERITREIYHNYKCEWLGTFWGATKKDIHIWEKIEEKECTKLTDKCF